MSTYLRVPDSVLCATCIPQVVSSGRLTQPLLVRSSTAPYPCHLEPFQPGLKFPERPHLSRSIVGNPYFLTKIHWAHHSFYNRGPQSIPVTFMDIRLEGSTLTLKLGRLEFEDPTLCPYQLGNLGFLISIYWEPLGCHISEATWSFKRIPKYEEIKYVSWNQQTIPYY